MPTVLAQHAGAAVSRETSMAEVWDKNWFGPLCSAFASAGAPCRPRCSRTVSASVTSPWGATAVSLARGTALLPAGLAVQTTIGVSELPIGPWQGAGVLALWAVAALLGGGLLLRARDV
ncbi:hypothetical protein ABT010_37250 [Streptomyces sp. NPDC002668]|uniref:hypothetical protein n=1 Tax=Streptomyces sp. NPDC002668 TaxID=3154422 RepID=UPI00332FA700